MDTSETYIKMCDCPEIQDGHEWENGEYYYFHGHKDIEEGTRIYCGSCFVEYEYRGDFRKEYIWLPQQGQLQEMSGLSWALFDKACIQREYVFSTTKELAGIQVAMKEKHNKVWTEDKWEYANL